MFEQILEILLKFSWVAFVSYASNAQSIFLTLLVKHFSFFYQDPLRKRLTKIKNSDN